MEETKRYEGLISFNPRFFTWHFPRIEIEPLDSIEEVRAAIRRKARDSKLGIVDTCEIDPCLREGKVSNFKYIIYDNTIKGDFPWVEFGHIFESEKHEMGLDLRPAEPGYWP